VPVSQHRDPDRLLPVDPATRALARDLYESVADKPILSPHSHVDPTLLLDDRAFADAVALLVTDDHYVTRLLHAGGSDLASVLSRAAGDSRAIWRTLAENWHRFDGTASGYWIEEELDGVFGIRTPLGPDTADAIFDEIGDALARPEFRPRALFRRFEIELLATTDDPMDALDRHEALAGADLGGRVVPTFRPDRYLDPDAPGFAGHVERLLAETGSNADFAGYVTALERRRAHFIRHGAVSADHGVEELYTVDLDGDEAERLFQAVLAGEAGPSERRAFRGHMLVEMARMSVEDGLVMTIHPGVLRNHSTATHARFGPDTGHDIPLSTEFTRGIRPLLDKYGLERDFHLVLFAVDETTYSRELAPLAGFYPSVFVGAPWWFLDAPDAMARHRSAITETAGFYRSSGFIDDTRALLSIPARHDTARRVDAGFLARLVVEGRVRRASAERIIGDLVDAIPREVFKL
jgi:glucuronate isomerase